jgi:hypothetical protein
VVNKLIRVQCMYWSNTTLFDGRGISSIYYVRHNYMFRRLTKAIFRLYMKCLVSSYTKLIWVVYSGEVGGEVDTRSRMCHGGWEVWVHWVDSTVIYYV